MMNEEDIKQKKMQSFNSVTFTCGTSVTRRGFYFNP